jgi:DNA-binding NarL/FixJ family response regulator
MTAPITISVVDDDDEIRESLVFLLNQEPGFRCVNQYRTAEAAMIGIPKDWPDVLLMDINLPAMSGIECVRKLKAIKPNLLVVMLTVYEDTEKIFQSLAAGACGYLLKRTSRAELHLAIKQVFDGGSPMSSHIARKVVQYFHQSPPQQDFSSLSPREEEVLQLLAQGYLYKEIAGRLDISLDTVRKHTGSIYSKLHVHSRTDAVVKYLQK